MTSLASIKKQIATLEAEAARITKAEVAAAVAKVRELIHAFELTAHDIGLGGTRAKRVVGKKTGSKRVGAGSSKYADPKTGKTWSGFGRVPAWIAGAKSRDAFLVDKSATAAPVKATASSKKAGKTVARKAAVATKPAAPSGKSTKAVARKSPAATSKAASAAASAGAGKKSASVKVAGKKSGAGKAASRKGNSAKGAPASAGATASPAAAATSTAA